MKAPYKKPLLAVESFTMTQSMARDCSEFFAKNQVNLSDIPACVWHLGGATIFADDVQCTHDIANVRFACYNNPTETTYTFHS